MNQVILIGNVGREAKHIEDKKLTIFDMATSQYYKENANTEEFKQVTQWHTIFCNSFTAEKTKNLKGGEKIIVTGVLKYKTILDDKGYKQKIAYIQSKKIELINSKKTDVNIGEEAQSVQSLEQINDEEIPF